jgi:hypothetical protein
MSISAASEILDGNAGRGAVELERRIDAVERAYSAQTSARGS